MPQELEQWVEQLAACNDINVLAEKFHATDNIPLHFFGDATKIYLNIVSDLRASTQTKTQFNRSYIQVPHFPLMHPELGQRWLEDNKLFDCLDGTVRMQVVNRPMIDEFTSSVSINGQENIGYLMFHPYQTKEYKKGLDPFKGLDLPNHPDYQPKLMSGVDKHKAMALVIEDICRYLIKNKIGTYLPKTDALFNPTHGEIEFKKSKWAPK